ncbi:MAG: response regulator [Promethearchaeota archaeon]
MILVSIVDKDLLSWCVHMNIMIVDDEEEVLELMTEILTLKFPKIKHLLTAKNGLNALELLDNSQIEARPHVVITDMRMPLMDGADLCKAIKKKYNNIKVALMTAFKETSDCFDEIFFKPIKFENLFDFITRNWIEND